MINQIINQVNKIMLTPQKEGAIYEFILLTFYFTETLAKNESSYIEIRGLEELIQIVTQFIMWKGNLNISLASIKIYYFLSKKLAILNEPDNTLLKLWKKLFGELEELSCDNRVEIRNKAFEVLQEIFCDNTISIPLEVWNDFFFVSIPRMIRFSEALRLVSRKDHKQPVFLPLSTPTFKIGDESQVDCKKEEIFKEESATNHEEEIDIAQKPWEDSIISILTTFGNGLKLFNKSIASSISKKNISKKAWSQLLDECISLIQPGTYLIVSTILKLVKQLSPFLQDLINENLNYTWRIFKEVYSWLKEQYEAEPCVQIPIGTKIGPEMFEALNTIFRCPCIIIPKNSSIIYDLCQIVNRVWTCFIIGINM